MYHMPRSLTSNSWLEAADSVAHMRLQLPLQDLDPLLTRPPAQWPLPPATRVPHLAHLKKVYTPVRPVGFASEQAPVLLWDTPTPQSQSVLEIKQRNLQRILEVPPGGNL
ncbi:hypothetical protein GSI_04104 [Ganoderma sinense ZZ0214-1]|uniref:Uncharacterized protein n=1 Tax=Ganoderma sinense ZZ0214-1 TaxID=1077348 RepID=A0A2G8SI95_9APHY|nr:hypothetical protein GSI_04104 [Ganoderma sinense ZZ0214-1]